METILTDGEKRFFWQQVEKVQHICPVVHNITNFVVMHTTANALLAFGASPIMAHEEAEMESIVSISSALVVNIGTLSMPWIASMEKAVHVASNLSIPIVIDPVGAGASSLRTETASLLASMAKQPIIRGNASEISAMAGVSIASRGVDSGLAVDASVEHAARLLAQKYEATVCVSGETDLVTDGLTLARIQGGSSLMPRITGMGCSATSLIGAVAGAMYASCTTESEKNETGVSASSVSTLSTHVVATIAAMGAMATAGSIAEAQCNGPGTFLPLFLDALFAMKEQNFLDSVAVTVSK